MSLLTVTVEPAGGDLLVALAGELDVVTAPELRQRLLELVAAGQRDLVVDLDGLVGLDDVGLGTLLGGAWRARAAGGSFALVCSNADVRRMLAVSGCDRAIDVHPTLAAARGAG